MLHSIECHIRHVNEDQTVQLLPVMFNLLALNAVVQRHDHPGTRLFIHHATPLVIEVEETYEEMQELIHSGRMGL